MAPPRSLLPPCKVTPLSVRLAPGSTVKSRKRLLPAIVTLPEAALRITLVAMVIVFDRTSVGQSVSWMGPPAATVFRNCVYWLQLLVRITLTLKAWVALSEVAASVAIAFIGWGPTCDKSGVQVKLPTK